jgi:hypothetical protein
MNLMIEIDGWMDGWMDADDDDDDDNGVGVPRAHVAYQCTDRSRFVGGVWTNRGGRCSRVLMRKGLILNCIMFNAISKALGWRSVYRRL